MAVLAQRRLKKFVEFAWNWIEPREFRDNWHIDVICEHLEAVNRGEIRRLLINIPPRHGKPNHVDDLVVTDRGRIRLGDIRVGDMVLTHRGRFRRVEAVHEQGVLPVLKITTHCGRVVRANDEHPFLTPRGWIQAQHLTTDDVLAAVVPVQEYGVPMRPEEARLLGYFVGDGCCKHESASITCFDDELADDIFHCCEVLGFAASWSKGDIPGKRKRINISGGVRKWLRKHGLAGQGSYTKRVPDAVMNGDRATIANFIAAYLGCDGWVGRKDCKRRDCVVQISSVNRPLLEDVQHLYLRLGINSRIRERRHGDYISYNLDLCGQDDVWRFKQEIPLISEKGEKLAEWGVHPTGFNDVLKPDPIVSIERDEPAECRCLTVAEDHSFTVQDIAVHNSLIFSVFWPVWTWLQEDMFDEHGQALPTIGKGTRFLFASYAERLSLRDSLRCRDIIKSPTFQRYYDLSIRRSMDTKIRFDIVGGGYRVATSVEGMATGEGGDIIGVDDPHNVSQGESEAVRENAVRWFAEVLPTRFNDPKRNALGVIMQRVNERDVSGYILANELGYTHLCLPARYERHHPYPCRADRRTIEGEVLWKGHMDEPQLAEIEKPLGAYACTPAESPVLMADLSLKPISEVRVGDEVVGFGPRPKAYGAKMERLMLKPAQVVAVYRYHAPVVKITLDSGETIRCTKDHKWFKKARNDGSWYSPAEIGSPLCRICPPRLPELSAEEERLAGWLGGFFDGEGTVSLCKKHDNRFKPSAQIKFFQGNGRNAPLCAKLESILEHFGFDFIYSEDERKPNKDAPCYGYRAYTLRGSCLPLMQRFLHIAKPVKWRDRIANGVFGSKFVTGHERPIKIEPDGEEDVFALETTTGNYVVWGLASSNSAGQLQQRPAPREGGMFERHWFQIVTQLPERRVRVRGWDIAGSVSQYDPDFTAGVLISKDDQGYYYIEDVVRFRGTSLMVDREMRAQAILDGPRTRITVPQDPGSAGKHHAEHMVRNLAGFQVKIIRPTGDKETRAKAFASQAEAGNVRILKAPWNNEFLNELCTFPNGRYKDQVDAAADAFNELSEALPGAGSRPMRW